MDNNTLTALRASIKKWEGIVDGTDADAGASNCALCHVFNRGTTCADCPVSAHTGQNFCAGTPYEAWDNEAEGHPFPHKPHSEEHLEMARAELLFLQSLLPENEEVNDGAR